jgi:hypothetical protein
MKTAFVTTVIILIFFSCSHEKDFILKDCEALKAQGIIDSFPYPVRPGSGEWKDLSSSAEMVEAVTVPEGELKRMCTNGLVYTCVYCPLFYDLMVCNFIHDCFIGLTEQINSFGELITRPDAGPELFDYYKTYFDTTKSNIIYTDAQIRIHCVETFFAQQEFLTKLDETELLSVLTDAYGKLKFKQRNNVSLMSIASSNYLIVNILYYNLEYEPIMDLIDRNNMEPFLNNQMWFENQPVDSIGYWAKKYILDH